MPKRNLLLADDSATIQKVVNLTFADEGIAVTCASDGDAAIQKFDQERPDIVLADVHMPGLDGYRLCEAIRSRDGGQNVPVILLVGSFEPFDEDEALRVGANDYLTKPFLSIRQLVTKVSELLSEFAPVDEPPSGEQAATQAAGEAPFTGDIDDLIAQSFVETAEMPYPPAETQEEKRTEPDDELIEIQHPASPPEPAFDDHLIEVQHSPDSDETTQEFRFEDAGEGFERAAQPENARVVNQSPFDSVATDEAVFEPELDETDEQWQPEAADDAAHGYEYDDSNLLELPDPRTNAQRPQDPSGQPERLQFPPELIDAIAQRVVEKISETLIREIAWQVVPQVAENLLREKSGAGPNR